VVGWRAVRRALGQWRGRFGYDRAYPLSRVAGEGCARRCEGRRLSRGPSCSRERAGAGRGGSVGWPRAAKDLAHDDGVGELRDQAAGSAAMRAGEDVEGEDAAQEFGPHRARAGGGAGSGRRVGPVVSKAHVSSSGVLPVVPVGAGLVEVSVIW